MTVRSWQRNYRLITTTRLSLSVYPLSQPSTRFLSTSTPSATAASTIHHLPVDQLVPHLKNSLTIPLPSKGTLNMVSLPIGCLSDISLRCLTTLLYSHIIVCEDTRIAQSLLYSYFSPSVESLSIVLPPSLTTVRTPKSLPKLWSYTPQNMHDRHPAILQALQQGYIVSFISDAGTPGISDPGNEIITYLQGMKYPSYLLRTLPGPSSLTTMITRSGWNIHNHYEGIAQDFAKRMRSYFTTKATTTSDKSLSSLSFFSPPLQRSSSSPFLPKKPSTTENNHTTTTGTSSPVFIPPASNGVLYLGFLPVENKELRQTLLNDIVNGRYKDIIIVLHEANIRLMETLQDIQFILQKSTVEVYSSLPSSLPSTRTKPSNVRKSKKGKVSSSSSESTTLSSDDDKNPPIGPVRTDNTDRYSKAIIIGRELTKPYEEITNYSSIKEAIEALNRILTPPTVIPNSTEKESTSLSSNDTENIQQKNNSTASSLSSFSLRGEFTILLGPTVQVSK